MAVEEAEELPDIDLAAHSWAYVPADKNYPARLRAARLSWMLWAVIGRQTVGINVVEKSPLQVCVSVSPCRLVCLSVRVNVWQCVGVSVR